MTITRTKKKSKVIIIGAGPAGLTAAYQLLSQKKEQYQVIVLEQDNQVGGLSKTIDYKGYKIDYGPHRFFSQSTRVNHLWQILLPVQGKYSSEDLALGKKLPLSPLMDGPNPQYTNKVRLIKNRITRILYLRQFFPYPIKISFSLFKKLGLKKIFKIGCSYFYIVCFPIRTIKNLEEYYINSFGKELYNIFFRDYTKKVWGVLPSKIPPDWGYQRAKGISIKEIILQAFGKHNHTNSLIEHFTYPKLGAGQIYEIMADKIIKMGGEIILDQQVTAVNNNHHNKITSVTATNVIDSSSKEYVADYVISSMPVKNLFASFSSSPPLLIKTIAENLKYRDYINVGILLNKMPLHNNSTISTLNNIIPDQWIYVQEKDLKIGRIDFFNNFSTAMLQDKKKIWLSAEYFCTEGDNIWNLSDKDLIKLTLQELIKINFINLDDVIDAKILKQTKAYPAYFGSYSHFDQLKKYLHSYKNLFLVGRNGMHKYNNMDHSILSGLTAADLILSHQTSKDILWNINTDQKYHESK